ncbi:MAG: CDP-glucose 4,6-dehydratase [Gammaproteobacteria bacterium]
MNSFWHNKRVLVTGHTGFKGSWLTQWLKLLGAEIIGFALPPPTDLNLFNVAGIAQNTISLTGDIRNYLEILEVIKKYQPSIVFHLAAQPLVRHSYLQPLETYATNVMGTLHLFEAIRQSKKECTIINVTSDKCYENKEWFWGYRENEPMGGYDPYSNSKACAELVTSAYRNSFFDPISFSQHKISLASARSGNVIGGGDWATDRLIPDIIRACINNVPVRIRNSHSIRPWQHVLEPLAGYLKLAQKLHEAPMMYGEPWNFGPNDDDAKPTQWLVEQVLSLWGGSNYWESDSSALHEATYLKLDCGKAKTRLGWQPIWNLERALVETVRWYKAYYQQQGINELMCHQIRTYSEQTKLMMNKVIAPVGEEIIK